MRRAVRSLPCSYLHLSDNYHLFNYILKKKTNRKNGGQDGMAVALMSLKSGHSRQMSFGHKIS